MNYAFNFYIKNWKRSLGLHAEMDGLLPLSDIFICASMPSRNTFHFLFERPAFRHIVRFFRERKMNPSQGYLYLNFTALVKCLMFYVGRPNSKNNIILKRSCTRHYSMVKKESGRYRPNKITAVVPGFFFFFLFRMYWFVRWIVFVLGEENNKNFAFFSSWFFCCIFFSYSFLFISFPSKQTPKACRE